MTLVLLAVPSVHFNGTSGDALLQGYVEAQEALQAAHKALCACAPHSRDYYVQDDHEAAFERARRGHFMRLARIERCMEEIEALGIAVLDQMPERMGPSEPIQSGETGV